MKYSSLVGLGLLAPFCFAQSPVPGSVDVSFQPPRQVFTHLVALSDGKYLAAGEFQFLGGTPLNRVARLNQDGSVDQSFDSGEAAGTVKVRGMIVQPDRRVVVFGDFKEFHGAERHRIVRLHPNGALDESFVPPVDPRIYAGGAIEAALVDPERGIYVGGGANLVFGSVTFGGQAFARLTMDGEPDDSFAPASSDSPARVDALSMDGQSRVIVSGADASGRAQMRRFHSDGLTDRSFKRVSIGGGNCRKIVLQPDGRILIAGSFTSINEQGRRGLARLHPDGALDVSFKPQFDIETVRPINVVDVALRGDGQLIAGGAAGPVGASAPFLAALLPDGSLGPEFSLDLNKGTIASSQVHTLSLSGQGTLALSGAFEFQSGDGTQSCARLFIDPALTPLLRADAASAELRLQVHPGRKLTVQSTSDLNLPWQTLASTNPVTSGVWLIQQPGKSDQAGFYRIR